MSDRIVDDAYNKIRNDIGTDFSRKKREEGRGRITELDSFSCSNCGYHNIHNLKELKCGCGNKVHGVLVYRRTGDTVVHDVRQGKKRRRKL
jgi:hypothetical protein